MLLKPFEIVIKMAIADLKYYSGKAEFDKWLAEYDGTYYKQNGFWDWIFP
jgi:hypothetical protein